MRDSLIKLALLGVFLLGVQQPSALAQFSGNNDERITNFRSEIRINPDASMRVTETISVVAQGIAIKRGIFRDFPTAYQDRYGNRIRVGFEVVDVKRNGRPETYRVESLSNGKRVRIGRAQVFLDPGPHTFTITYKTNRQLGFFEEFDELYWNVTGSQWDFEIERAQAVVYLPGSAPVTQYDAFTGRPGAKGKDWTLTSPASSPISFETTRTLRSGEGLTIAVAFPKGFVAEPTATERTESFMRDNAGTTVAFLGLLLVGGYYFFIWDRHGRDPEGGTIIPRYQPPPGLSPGASRMTRQMGFDQKAYTTALISLGVKGAVEIDELGVDALEEAESAIGKTAVNIIKSLAGTDYQIRRSKNVKHELMSRGEAALFSSLLGGRSSIALKQKNHAEIRASINNLKTTLKAECEGVYFQSNLALFLIGITLTVLTGFVSAIASPNSGLAFVTGGIAMALSVAMSMLVVRLFGERLGISPVSSGSIKGLASRIIRRLGIFIMIPFILINGLGIGMIGDIPQPLFPILMAALGCINVLFYHLLKAPTVTGRKVMDQLEGFRMYLATAEKERLNMLNPPDKTPELFEKYLPYALALDVENEWSEQFAEVLAKASMDQSASGYHPRWYRGSNWNARNPAGFATALGGSLSSTIASSATAPGSSSGSGGGGFSGGGGGGGGGGGW